MPDFLAEDPGFVAVVVNLLSSAKWTPRDYVVGALAEVYTDRTIDEIDVALDELLDFGTIASSHGTDLGLY